YKVMEFRRKNKHNPFLLDDDVLELLDRENISNFDNTEDRTQALASCVKKLPRSDQEFVKLKYADGFTLKKLAQRCGLSIATAYRNLARIHGLLIECVRRDLGVGA
ncbi:MAG: sigma factor-like helix-turn-helix DNA-binding protein, partial [Phycisphaerae bacterium]